MLYTSYIQTRKECITLPYHTSIIRSTRKECLLGLVIWIGQWTVNDIWQMTPQQWAKTKQVVGDKATIDMQYSDFLCVSRKRGKKDRRKPAAYFHETFAASGITAVPLWGQLIITYFLCRLLSSHHSLLSRSHAFFNIPLIQISFFLWSAFISLHCAHIKPQSSNASDPSLFSFPISYRASLCNSQNTPPTKQLIWTEKVQRPL